MRSFDLFPKATHATLRRTKEGAMISLVASVLAVCLVVVETLRFATVQMRERLDLVDSRFEESTVEISFQVDFFALTCNNVKFQALTRGLDEPHDISKDVVVQPAFESLGCATSGTIVVPRTTGDLHVALSPHAINPFQTGITLEDYRHFNASHRINMFRIDKNKDMSSLDGVVRIFNQTGSTASFTYELDIVPVVYRDLNNNTRASNMFRVNDMMILTTTEVEAAIAVQKLGLPGVYFSYKFSPLSIVKWEEKIPLAEYLANLMAIFGGVTTTVALIDVSFFHNFRFF